MDDHTSAPVTTVIAPRLDDAVAWCYRNGVMPHSRHTRLRSTSGSLHATWFSTGDRLIVLPGCPEALLEYLAPALVPAPGPSIVADLVAWWDNLSPRPFDHTFGATP